MAMKEIRCKRCGRMLFRGIIREVEIKCPKCGYLQIVYDFPPKRVDNFDQPGKIIEHSERFDRQ